MQNETPDPFAAHALSLLLVLMMIPLAAFGEGLFPDLDQLFGTAMPSVSAALGRKADKEVENCDGLFEIYRDFSDEDYSAFGTYLDGLGAVRTLRTQKSLPAWA